MTDTTLQADFACNNLTDRRAVLGLVVAAPAAALIPGTASASDIDAAWVIARRRYEDARAGYDAFTKIHDEIYRRWDAAEPSLDMIDWRSGEFAFMDRNFVAYGMDVEEEWQLFLSTASTIWHRSDLDERKARKRRALDSVIRFRREREVNYERSGMRAAEEKLEQLDRRASDAAETLISTPPPSGAALAYKIEVMRRECEDCEFSEEYWAVISADAQRIGGETSHA